MKKLVGLFVATLGVIAIASCNKEPDPSLEIGVDADVVVESPSASYTFTFTTNQAWTAESDSDWLTLEATSGSAGDIELVAAYTANNTNDYRYAKVTVNAGKLSEEYTLAQKPVAKASEDKRIDKAAQTISIPVNKDADAVVVALESDWLTKDEAASTNTALVLSATANESTFAREVVVTVTNNGKITTYTIRQSGNSIDLTLTKLVYLGRKQFIYNSAAWSYNHFDEFAFVCVSEDNKEVVLTVNAKEIAGEVKAVPDSTYTFDAGSLHTPGTFTANPKDIYYTHSEDLSSIYDGEIVVEVVNGVYTVLATLNESETVGKTYSFIGSVETIIDESLGGQVYSISYNGQYETYFTEAQAKKWYMELFVSNNYDSEIPYLTYIWFNLYGEKTQDNSQIPTGTFTIVDSDSVSKIDSPYANGVTNYQPQTIVIGGNDDEGVTAYFAAGGTVTITKQDDGKYTFAFDTDAKIYYRDDNWTIVDSAEFAFKPVVEDVVLPEVDLTKESKPILDEGAVLGAPASNYFQMYWYGQKLGDGYDTFWGGFQNVGGFGGYTVQFAITVDDSKYTYEQYNTTTYSRTAYTPVGTYTFSTTPGDFKLVPSTNSYVQNPYTGTKFFVTGGSIKLEAEQQAYGKAGTITYDLKCTPGTVAKDEDSGDYVLTPSGAEVSFTGSHPLVWYRVTDRATGTAAIALFKVAE